MSTDPTEDVRRAMLADPDRHPVGPRWDTAELQRDFEVLGFMAPFVVVRRRSDGAKGTLEFAHSPRVYFNFEVAE